MTVAAVYVIFTPLSAKLITTLSLLFSLHIHISNDFWVKTLSCLLQSLSAMIVPECTINSSSRHSKLRPHCLSWNYAQLMFNRFDLFNLNNGVKTWNARWRIYRAFRNMVLSLFTVMYVQIYTMYGRVKSLLMHKIPQC